MPNEQKRLSPEDDDLVVVLTDEDGEEFYCREEMIIPVDGQTYALLVSVSEEDGHAHDCDCGCGCGEEEAFIARIAVNGEGEEEYVTDLTDEEFQRVQEAYDLLIEE